MHLPTPFMFKRSVRCIDCGFLGRRSPVDTEGKSPTSPMQFVGWGLIELPAARRTATSLDLNKGNGGLNCEKGVVNMYGMEDAALIAELERPRRCDWYVLNDDLSFAQTAQARHDRREFQRRIWLERVIVGVIAAALGALATRLVTGFPF